MIVHDCPQRSPEWFALRAGRLTSTGADAMLATLKSGGEAAGRRNLRVRLALERITGKPLEREFQSQAMKDGNEREIDATHAYEALTGSLLQTTGFIAHDELMAGCSLDGHVGDFEGIVEVKSPIHATHLDYIRSGLIPTDYLRQVTHALWITGAQWCDWLSYQPDFPESLRVRLVRVQRTSVDLAAYELMARQFLREVDQDVQSIQDYATVSA